MVVILKNRMHKPLNYLKLRKFEDADAVSSVCLSIERSRNKVLKNLQHF